MIFQDWLQSSWREAGYPTPIESINDGNLPRWLKVLNCVPEIENVSTRFGNTVAVKANESNFNLTSIEHAITALIPWRKGPFNLFDSCIDSEWQSQLKWSRIQDCVSWTDKQVLDVGSGNGYFGFRALGAGAQSVVGIESSMLPVLQAALVNWFARSPNIVIPRRFGYDELTGQFDVVLSMGVIYHQRDFRGHLEQLVARCAIGGTVILESLIADADFMPNDRYAGMRNVWHVPSIETIQKKLENVGFIKTKLVDVSLTTEREQRRTNHMPFRSLSDVLDPSDPSRTVEGYPAPKRAVLMASRG